MKNRLGTTLMFIGTALVLAALSLFCFNQWEARRAEERVCAALPEIDSVIRENRDAAGDGPPDPYDPEMTVKEIDGYGYIGILSIPSLNLELPVMSEWDYSRLKIAPCRYAGSTKSGSLVICAHNYPAHFGKISELEPGDAVLFTDMDGRVWRYKVSAVEVLLPTAVEQVCAGTDALTLFTCTYGGQSRVTVRCSQNAAA